MPPRSRCSKKPHPPRLCRAHVPVQWGRACDSMLQGRHHRIAHPKSLQDLAELEAQLKTVREALSRAADQHSGCIVGPRRR